MRDSSDARYLYALSFQTERGPTSVRVQYTDGGCFRLDASDSLLSQRLPKFRSILDLVDFYASRSNRQSPRHSRQVCDKRDEPIVIGRQLVRLYNHWAFLLLSLVQVWLDNNGQVHSDVILKRPLVRQCPSLQHLARLSWNRLASHAKVHCTLTGSIPPPIQSYLKDYPYIY